MVTIRQLRPGDEDVLAVLARDEGDFGADGSPARTPVTGSAAAAYLADPHVLHWVAEADGEVVGHLLCHVQRRRAGDARQLMLYEIGVRAAYRRRGIGRALLDVMGGWMRDERVASVWLLADAGAVAFYEACGFVTTADRPAMMRRRPSR